MRFRRKFEVPQIKLPSPSANHCVCMFLCVRWHVSVCVCVYVGGGEWGSNVHKYFGLHGTDWPQEASDLAYFGVWWLQTVVGAEQKTFLRTNLQRCRTQRRQLWLREDQLSSRWFVVYKRSKHVKTTKRLDTTRSSLSFKISYFWTWSSAMQIVYDSKNDTTINMRELYCKIGRSISFSLASDKQ